MPFLSLIALPVVHGDEMPHNGTAAVLQPFVDDNSMAAAVTAVADKSKILDLATA